MAEELGAENGAYEWEKEDKKTDIKMSEEPKDLSEYWAEKARARDKLADKMEVLYEAHKKTRGRQVGGDHYKKCRIQPWDVIDQGPTEQAIGFYRYNALKYIMRAGTKGEFKEDIAKAQHYLEKLLEILE